MPNSEVKLSSADDSVGSPHVKVGHRQGLILKASLSDSLFFYPLKNHSWLILNDFTIKKILTYFEYAPLLLMVKS
jgi:hypothetical protein